MKKYIPKSTVCALVLILFCFWTLMPGVQAAQALPRVIDNADLFTPQEEQALEERCGQIRQQYEFDVVLLTEPSIGSSTPMTYADDYYDYNGYGVGSGHDGLLFLLAMESRDYYTSTTGYGITAFTDYGIDYIGEQIVPYLSDGEYAEAFNLYLNYVESFLTQARQGQAFDVGNKVGDNISASGELTPQVPLTFGQKVQRFFDFSALDTGTVMIATVIALVGALVVTLIMRSAMNTAKKQYSATQYVRANSMHIDRSNDIFLYRHVSRTRRQTQSSGGSSTHIGSSGTSHGGGGGKF